MVTIRPSVILRVKVLLETLSRVNEPPSGRTRRVFTRTPDSVAVGGIVLENRPTLPWHRAPRVPASGRYIPADVDKTTFEQIKDMLIDRTTGVKLQTFYDSAKGRPSLCGAVSPSSRSPGREGVTRMVQVWGKSEGRRELLRETPRLGSYRQDPEKNGGQGGD